MKKIQRGRINARIRCIIYFICIFLCLFMAVYIGTHEQEEDSEAYASYVSLPPDTYAKVEDPASPLGIREEYLWELSSQEDRSTCFITYTIHHYTRVYLDEELIYTLDKSDAHRISHGIGGKWVYIPIHLHPEEPLRLRVVSEPVYRNVLHRQPEFYLGDPVSLFRAVRTQDVGNIVISLVGVFAGLCAICFWLAMRFFRRKKLPEICHLGVLMLLLGICRLSGMRSSSILFSVSSTWFSYVSNFSLLLAWITFHFFIDHRYSDYPSSVFDLTKLCSFIIVLILLVLQAFGLAEMRNLLWVVHAGIVFDLLVLGIVSYHRMRASPSRHSRSGFAFGMLLTVGILIDILRLYVSGISRSLFFSYIVFLVYTVYIFAQYLYDLQTEAEHDRLTGLYNRHYWEKLSAQLDKGGQDYALLLIDLDGMKAVNDNFGHSAGDALLIDYSDSLKRAMPMDCITFRLGGDEFLVLIPNADPQRIAYAVESLTRQINAYNSVPGNIRISYSLGTAFSADHANKDTSALFHIADRAMYEVKRTKTVSTAGCSTKEELVKSHFTSFL